MKSILITGGAGFIGSNLVEDLLKGKNPLRVICIDNLDPFYDVALKKENLKPFLRNKNFKFYQTDIRDKAALIKIFKKEKPEYVVHLAAKANARKSVNEAEEYSTVNILGTQNLLELAKEYGVKKFVFASSSSVYGNSAKPPFAESDTSDFPLSPYGATKKSAEVLAYTYYHNFQLPVIVLRIFNAYGARLRPDLVLYKWVQNILQGKEIELSGKGKRQRDFTYVGDTVRALRLALNHKGGFEILNIGNSKPVSLVELLQAVEKATGQKAIIKTRPSHKASVELTHANTNRAKKVLGWQPEMPLDQGISRFVKWFRDNRLKKSV